MAASANVLEQIDLYIAELFAGWNVYTTLIAMVLTGFLIYPLITWQEPDIHPLLLARQSTASPVRNEGESSIYRSIESPYGYPLRAGLNIKDPGAPRWSAGRNGDLRDIWRQAVRGVVKDDGSPTGEKGKIITILGKEKVVQRDLDSITQEIKIIGQHVTAANGKVAAVYLSNSVELLACIFAAAFYGFQTVLIPQDLPIEDLLNYLNTAKADVLVAETGRLQLDAVVKSCPELSHVLWVTNEGSRHLDWNEVPEGIGGKIEISVWHEMVEERRSATDSEVPPHNSDIAVAPLKVYSPTTPGSKVAAVEYTSSNLVSAVASLISAFPRTERLSPSDIVLSTATLTSNYPLIMTFAALFSNASIALNSVAGKAVDLAVASSGVFPTVIIASPESAQKLTSQLLRLQTSLPSQFSQWLQKRYFASGVMPKPNAFTKVAATSQPSFAKLRLLCIPHSPGSKEMTSDKLADLRIALGARVAYALTVPEVAGAICQTNPFDYRLAAPIEDWKFGPPLSSVEIKLNASGRVNEENPEGKLFVAGPAVCNGSVELDFFGRIGDDNTLVAA